MESAANASLFKSTINELIWSWVGSSHHGSAAS
jgi:hypothetical protein